MDFAADPEWAELAVELGFPKQSDEVANHDHIDPVEIDVSAWREYGAEADAEWEKLGIPQSKGYTSRSHAAKVRDGTDIDVKVSCPNAPRLQRHGISSLPVLFITHGGGFVSGSHASEEAWLIKHLYESIDVVMVSVEYRLGPENKFPRWFEDCIDVLEDFLRNHEAFVSGLNVNCDLNRLILGGSSAGATISATLSLMCRDRKIAIRGVLLNVPMVCDYRRFPSASSVASESYIQCNQDGMGSNYLVECWNQLLPSPTTDIDLLSSPLLRDLKGLPPHLVFVAGRDPLRDEGIAYVKKLEAAGVVVKSHIYPGVPHVFAKYEQLGATRRFTNDLVKGWTAQLLA